MCGIFLSDFYYLVFFKYVHIFDQSMFLQKIAYEMVNIDPICKIFYKF